MKSNEKFSQNESNTSLHHEAKPVALIIPHSVSRIGVSDEANTSSRFVEGKSFAKLYGHRR